MIHFLLLLIAAFLILLNAFFVAAEFGMVKIRNTRVKTIEQMYGLRGKILAKIHHHLDSYLSACQLGITLASLGLGWVGKPAVAHLLTPMLRILPIQSEEIITFISFLISFSILSFLHIVVGELMPKTLAIRQSEVISVWTAIPLYGFYWLMYPAIWLLNSCSNMLLKIMRLHKTHHGEGFFSTEEIKLILNASHVHGELNSYEAEILEHTLDFAELRVPEVMRPAEEMIALDINQSQEQLLETALKYRYSRYPIYEDSKANIIGILHVKDLFAALYAQGSLENLKSLIRPVLKVSHRLPALDLLRKFRSGMPHFALVFRGKDRLIGFITLDNLLHVLIGRIKDEFHKTHDDWKVNSDGSLSVKGDCSIYSLERALDYDIKVSPEEEAEIDTITGLILNRLGYLPEEGEQIEFPEFTAKIEKREATHIQKIKLIPKISH